MNWTTLADKRTEFFNNMGHQPTLIVRRGFPLTKKDVSPYFEVVDLIAPRSYRPEVVDCVTPGRYIEIIDTKWSSYSLAARREVRNDYTLAMTMKLSLTERYIVILYGKRDLLYDHVSPWQEILLHELCHAFLPPNGRHEANFWRLHDQTRELMGFTPLQHTENGTHVLR